VLISSTGFRADARLIASKVRRTVPMPDDLPAGLVMTDETADLFKSMGHPARIQLLEMLADGAVAVSQLRDVTGLEPSNLSQHLGVLRRQRLIIPSRRNGRLFYELASPQVNVLLAAARSLLGSLLHTPRLTLSPLDEARQEEAFR
jgi:DNA-binding transcriptional ArsR family regulator